jgi:hypothetical protein
LSFGTREQIGLGIVLGRDAQAGGVEDVHVLSRRDERHLLARRRRFSTTDPGDETACRRRCAPVDIPRILVIL